MISLQDPIRNFAYDLILDNIKEFSSILDIGTRDSGFAAYLSSLGHTVTTIERDANFVKSQLSWSIKLNTMFKIGHGELINIKDNFDIITAVYALQHNVEKDIDCYKHCAKIANKSIHIVNEYNESETKLHIGRGDGDMRIYSYNDIFDRIIDPIKSVTTIEHYELIFMKFDFDNQTIDYSDKHNGNAFYLKIELS